ncbi:hypothetical protein SAMD00019534_106880 [Acytostelium subglobosum LB1]|uniref:hypothetical protein n=1 Tax=Acytostelium subglobosum LB1 TaxID=1410327 RepID=UPI000644BDCE|nr:hypothetical protein SAMD00019534_106880 [Acytostelium subglobosum LB1]GAM27512.1 hypothetical protein SAMD00019534_106880 [Acytostelium subglobosum LB1]|eukprot:XP_012749577.1 hypothetical protein SAMD00019534_106880 [Acytostelium subglobosum LB1]
MMINEEDVKKPVNELLASEDFRVRLMLTTLEHPDVFTEDADDTRYEKLKDRLDRMLSDPNKVLQLLNTYNGALLDVPIRILLLGARDGANASDSGSDNDTGHHHGEHTLSINLRIIALILRHSEVYHQYVVSESSRHRLSIQQTLHDICVVYTVAHAPLVRDSALAAILSMLTSGHAALQRDLLRHQSHLITNIFDSFKCPSNFVSRTAVKLLSCLVRHLLNHDDQSITTSSVSTLIDCALHADSQQQSSVDVKLCLLDMFIHILVTKSELELDTGYLIANHYVQKSCMMLLDNDRLVRERVIELLSLCVQSSTVCQSMHSLAPMFISLAGRLVQTRQREFITTSIDLVGVLEATSLFPFTTSSTTLALFSQLDNIIQSINQTTSTETSTPSNFILTDSILYSIVQATRVILARNPKCVAGLRPSLLNLIFTMATTPSGYKCGSFQVSTKTIKESLHCLVYIDLEYLSGNTMGLDMGTRTIVQQLLNATKSSHRQIVHQAFQTIDHHLHQLSLDIVSDPSFIQQVYRAITNILMSPSGDLREVGLAYLARLFACPTSSPSPSSSPSPFQSVGIPGLLENGIASMIVNKLADSDSYVRSSALEVISVLSASEHGWSKLLATNDHTGSMLKREQLQGVVIDDNAPTKVINEDVMNANQINLVKYTEMLKLEHNQHQHQHQHIHIQHDLVSNGSKVDEYDGQSFNADAIDFEWDDEEFRELVARTQEETTTFLTDEDDYIDTSIQHPRQAEHNVYPFPFSILLFFSDEESYPRM